jgi:hypothetical protein
MKIIFLDMDGVLCTFKAHLAQGKPSKFHGFMEALDREAIGLLNYLHDYPEFDTKYVLSSAWRIFHTQEEMESHLKNYGWTGIFHEDWKTNSFNSIRGEEIQEWLERHPEVDGYVILDDDNDMTEEQIANHFVHTDEYDGISFKQFIQAERILYGTEARL